MRDIEPTTTAHRARKDLAIAGSIFFIALVARLLLLFCSPDRDWPHSVFYEGDAIVWVEWASAIDRGEAFQFNLPIHPPGVAYPLAYLYSGVRLRDFAGMKALWCVMSAAACGLTYLACVWGGLPRRVGVIAALLLCFSFGQYVLATSLNSETPYVLLLTLLTALTPAVMRRPTRWGVAGMGLAHGLALLLRPEHPLLLAMWIGWMAFARSPGSSFTIEEQPIAQLRMSLRSRLVPAGAMIVIALLICLPWTVRAVLAVHQFNTVELDPIKFNLAPVVWTEDGKAALNALPPFARPGNFRFICDWAQRERLSQVAAADVNRFFGDLLGDTPTRLSPIVLVSNQGPFSFALANHPRSDGGFSRIALAHPMMGGDPKFEFAFSPHNRIFNHGFSVGWQSIMEDPGGWMRLVIAKFQRFGNGMAMGFGAANLPLDREGVRHRVDMLAAQGSVARIWRIVIVALIVAGAVLALARRLPIALWLIIILNKIIITILFYGYARQAASIAPAWFILIAIAVDTLLLPLDRRWSEWRHWQRTIALLLCLLMLALDVMLARGKEDDRIVIGPMQPRPDLGPGAFTSYGEIEIRYGLP